MAENGKGTGLEAVERTSMQPRFKEDAESIVFSVASWVYKSHLQEPALRADTRQYDDWLLTFAQTEPHLAGVLASVINNDKNRGWNLTGGLRQVARISDRLRNVEDGQGWRSFAGLQSQSFWNTNIGAITEVERDPITGAMLSLYHVDPTRSRLTRSVDKPLRYYPYNGKMQSWHPEDYFRTVSLPDVRESWNKIGFCAVNRCLSLAKMMVSIYEHDLESLGALPPKGYLVGNVSKKVYEEAVAKRKQAIENNEEDFDILVLLGGGAGAGTDIKFVPFSNLPTNFDAEVWTRLLMYGYALAFTYDAQEFYPVQGGSFGRGAEATLQAEKAASKGELSFVLDFQDNLQRELPETVDFQFNRNDPKITLQQVEADQAQADLFTSIYEAKGGEDGTGGISREEYRVLLAEHDIIHPEWTESEEDTSITDVERLRQTVRDNDSVRRAAAAFPADPVVRYSYPNNKMRMLWESGADLLRRQYYPAATANQHQPLQDALERRRSRLQSRDGKNANTDLLATQRPDHAEQCACSSCQDANMLAERAMRAEVRAGVRIVRTRLVRREAEPGDVLYEDEDGDFVITTGDVELAISEAQEQDERLYAFLTATVVEQAIEWVTSTKRYRDTETGRFVSSTSVRSRVNASLERGAGNAGVLAEQVATGALNAPDWNGVFREDIKREYIRQYVAAVGGRDNMTPADWGSIGGMLKEQYRYLDNFTDEIAAGRLTEGQIRTRAQMYINSAREAYERGNARVYGVVLPYYPGDGSTECLTNCKCFWDIKEIYENGTLTGWNCRWKQTAMESCDDCNGRATNNNPLFIAA